jgi:hypothetical protein
MRLDHFVNAHVLPFLRRACKAQDDGK